MIFLQILFLLVILVSGVVLFLGLLAGISLELEHRKTKRTIHAAFLDLQRRTEIELQKAIAEVGE